ncbi:MAG: hypothetical protein ACK5LY_09485 [Lachnospirales bacterium]
MKFTIEDFIFTIVEELEQYEDLDLEYVDKWCHTFEKMVKNGEISKKNLVKEGDELYFVLNDETEVFAIVDDYIEAIENNSITEYWKTFL